jgi:hypothetical protein
MWDFDFGRTLGMMARTWPFIVLRLIVYFTITVAYVVATGVGAGVGFGVGHIFGGGDGPAGFAVFGGLGGILLVSVVLYWLREYILYMVKAGHIAVLVELIDGHELPEGNSQIEHARAVVTERFGEANVLFVLDQLVKGVIGVITGLLGGAARFLPIPGLQGLIGFINTVIRLSLTYVDEVILGYNIRLRSDQPFETARHGVVLYAQNGMVMVKNAVWLALMMWGLAFFVFLVMLAPAGAVFYLMPGQLAGWSFVLAIIFAWAIKAALIEPFVIAALMQVYFKVIEGQVPDPEWDERLAGASRHFRELKDKAVSAFGGRPASTPEGA